MAPKYILEQFLEAELLINITEHLVSPVEFLFCFLLMELAGINRLSCKMAMIAITPFSS
jgi:hypothetical protein